MAMMDCEFKLEPKESTELSKELNAIKSKKKERFDIDKIDISKNTITTLDEELKVSKSNIKVDIFKDITNKMLRVYKAKNNDYGDSFSKVRKEYPQAICIRLSDKLERLKTLMNGNKQMVDESIKDTLMDLANYCILEMIEMEIEENE
ncbi:nucleotide modification associated domain-containing protein [Clostridium senegalense]